MPRKKSKAKKRRAQLEQYLEYFFRYGPHFDEKVPNYYETTWGLDFYMLKGVWISKPWDVRAKWKQLKFTVLAGADLSSWWATQQIEELQFQDKLYMGLAPHDGRPPASDIGKEMDSGKIA